MSRALPFSQLLDTLRQHGLALSVRECELFYRLLERWHGESPGELRDAIAALLGKNAQDVALIRKVFDEFTALPPPAAVVRPLNRRWIVALCLTLLVSGGVGYGAWRMWRQPDEVDPTEEVINQPPPQPAPGVERPPAEPPPAVKVVSIPAPSSERWPWMTGLALAASAATLLAYARLRRRQQHLRTRARALKTLPGPQNFELPAPPYQGFAPLDLDEFATWLSRISDATIPSRTLDIERSVRASVRDAMPRLLFAPRPPIQPLLVLDDMSEEMRPWRRKLDAFVQGVEQRGVSIERWYFDTDPSFVSRRPFGARVPLAKLAGRASETSLLLLSSGSGVLDAEQRPASWLRTVAQFDRRVWLHPVSDPLFWRRELARVPCSVHPLSRPGLAAAARALGADVPEPALRAGAPRATNAEDLAALRKLAAIYPEADLTLLMALRERLLPHVSESAVLVLRDERAAWGGGRVRFADDERWNALQSGQHMSAEREQQVRRQLLELLDANEPPADSGAHLRWRLSRAQQHVFLPEHVESVQDELGQLANSAIGAEVENVLSFLRRAPGAGALRAVGRAGRRAARRGWGAPRVSDVLRALVVGGMVGLLALLPAQPPHERRETVPNRTKDTYTLQLVENESTSPPRKARLRVGVPEDLAAPTELLRALPAGGFEVLPMQLDAQSDLSVAGGYWYLVRGKQTQGEGWAISEWRKVGSDQTVVIRFFELGGGELIGRRFTVTGKLLYNGISGRGLSLPDGTYTLEAKVEGYEPQTVPFVVPQPTGELMVELKPDMPETETARPGTVMMSVSFVLPMELKASDLQVNGEPWSGNPLRVKPGTQLRLRALNAYYDYVDVVTAGPRIVVVAKPSYGLLRVIMPQGFASEFDIDPPLPSFGEAEARIDGSRTLTYRGKPDSYVVKDRVGAFARRVEIVAGQTVELRLEPKQAKPKFVLDLARGTLNGLRPDTPLVTVKKELPFFNDNDGEFGGGSYYGEDGFAFLYRQIITVDASFSGTVTPYSFAQLNEGALDADPAFVRAEEGPKAISYVTTKGCVELIRGTNRLARLAVHARGCDSADLIGDYLPATRRSSGSASVALRACQGDDGKAYRPLPTIAQCLERIELQGPSDPTRLENVILQLKRQLVGQHSVVPLIGKAFIKTSQVSRTDAAVTCLESLDFFALEPWEGAAATKVNCTFSLDAARSALSAD